jgi:uncharacterized membrane protein YphA (DoxX/SURF4 family)/thiol-disulfide isomerase/thioredoxin
MIVLLSIGLGCLFVVAGVTKLSSRDWTSSTLTALRIPGRLVRPLSVLLPFGELAVGLGLIVPATSRFAALAAVGMLATFAIVLARSLGEGRRPACRCFGSIGQSQPISGRTIARSVLLSIPASLVFVNSAEIPAWSKALVVTLTAAIIASSSIHVYVIGRLHGSETTIAPTPRTSSQKGLDAVPVHTGDPNRQLGTRDQTAQGLRSLPEISRLPVRLPGGRVSSLQHETRTTDAQLIVMFLDPDCGSCFEIVNDLARWQKDLRDVPILIVARDEERAARMRLHMETIASQICAQIDPDYAPDCGISSTPAAMLLSREGELMSAVAMGASQVEAFLSALSRTNGSDGAAHASEREGRPRRPNPRAVPWGTNIIDVSPYLGRPLLILFARQACDDCSRAIDAVKQTCPTGVQVLLISIGGTIADMARIPWPTYCDVSGQVAQALGILATPASVFLGGDGRLVMGPIYGEEATTRLLMDFDVMPGSIV